MDTQTFWARVKSFYDDYKVFLGVLAALLVLAVIAYQHYNTPKLGFGTLVPEDPQIVLLNGDVPFTVKSDKYTITPLALFNMRARVLHVHHYSWDRESDLSPVDFAIGWGLMSNQDLIDQVTITQSDRWYYYHYDHQLPVSNQYIARHSFNLHAIPAGPDIDSVLESVRSDEIVDIQGYLVRVNGDDGYVWKSSLNLTDTGAHACKLVLIEKITIEH